MITGLTHIHSSFRYLILIFILLAIIDAAMGVSGSKPYTKRSKMFGLFTLIFAHIQGLVGLLLYFLGDKGLAFTKVEGFMSETITRFFAVEHITGMIIALTLITMGYSKAKRQLEDAKKHKTTLVYYGIALVIIFITIPWPFFRAFGTWM